MKKIVSLAIVLALLTLPMHAGAEANWWSDIGPANGTRAPEPTPQPTVAPNVPPIDDDDHGDVPDDGPTVDERHWSSPLFGPGVLDITTQAYGGEVQYARVGNWTMAYGSCDDHFCLFGWNETTREYHILAETNVPGFVPAGDVFAYYGEVRKGKYSWLVKNPDEEQPVNLGLNELNSVFWSDENYLYYFTYGKGTGTTHYRMDHQGKNKKQLGKLNGRAIAMTPDGGVLVFDSSKNRVQRFKDGKHETLYAPSDEILTVVSNGRETWVAHKEYVGWLEKEADLETGELAFRFPGSLLSYAATTDQIIAVLDDGAIQLPVYILNDLYRAHAVVGTVAVQEDLAAEITPGWLNRIVVWGQRESLAFYTPQVDSWIPYGYYDLESAKAAGYPGYEGEPRDAPAQDRQIERRIPENLLGEEADILQDAQGRGLLVTHDSDGMYTYIMDPVQYQALLDERKSELIGMLEMLPLRDGSSVKSYEANDDFSRLTLRVDREHIQGDVMAMLTLTILGKSAPAYQALLREEAHPASVVAIVDDATGKEIVAFNAPDDFL